MRKPSSRLQRDTLRIQHRIDSGVTARGSTSPTYQEPGFSVPGSFQPVGDTGRRQNQNDDNQRMGSDDSWRFFIRAEDAAAIGLNVPYVHEGDKIIFHGREYICRGEPLPMRREPDGTVRSYFVDTDGDT